MTYITFELFLLNCESKRETNALLWGKVLAEKRELPFSHDPRIEELAKSVIIYFVGSRHVLGEVHEGAEDDFVESLIKHAKSFTLYIYIEGDKQYRFFNGTRVNDNA